MSTGAFFSTLTIGVLAFSIAAPSFAESLNESVYSTGTVLGNISIERIDANGSLQSEELDAMLQFFQDGGAEYDFRSLADSSVSCSGELIFVEYIENTDWQNLELQLVPKKSNSESCPPTGFLFLSRRPDAANSDPIKVGFRPDADKASNHFVAGAVYLTEGVPEYRGHGAKDASSGAGDNVDMVTTAADGSSKYPLYDGVYVGLVDGSYVQMELLVRKASSLHFGGMPYAITRPFGDPSENRLAPVVDVDEVKSIYVKSGSDVVTAIMPVFDAEGLLFQGGSPVPNAWVNIGRTPFSASQFQDIFAASDCAFTPQQMNRISLSRTEYELIFENSRISPRNLATAAVNTKWSASKPVYDPSMPDKCVGLVRSRGFAVLVEGPAHKGIQTVLGPQRGSVFWVMFKD